MNITYEVTPCPEAKFYEILKSPEIASRLTEHRGSSSAVYDPEAKLLTCNGHTMLFQWELISGSIYQAHIAIPKESLKYSRLLAQLGIFWLFKDQPKMNMLVVEPMKGKMANYCTRVGFIKMPSNKINMYYLTREMLGDMP